MIINSINNISKYKSVITDKARLQYYSDTITITFKGDLTYGKMPEDIKTNLASTCSVDTSGVIKTDDTGYLAQIFKYQSQASNIYAIKKVWSEDLAKHVTADPVGQLKTEAEVYNKLVGIAHIPKFYCYNGDFSKNRKALANNYLVIGWVDGKQASTRGTFYDFKLVSKENLAKIYRIIGKFDKRGVLHNDLWAGNILFMPKDVNIIRFQYDQNYLTQSSTIKKTNLDSFKERFLNRYFSDVFQKLGEKELVDIYIYTTYQEINQLKDKAEFFKSIKKKEAAAEFTNKIVDLISY